MDREAEQRSSSRMVHLAERGRFQCSITTRRRDQVHKSRIPLDLTRREYKEEGLLLRKDRMNHRRRHFVREPMGTCAGGSGSDSQPQRNSKHTGIRRHGARIVDRTHACDGTSSVMRRQDMAKAMFTKRSRSRVAKEPNWPVCGARTVFRLGRRCVGCSSPSHRVQQANNTTLL
jgi:hypothetical protein